MANLVIMPRQGQSVESCIITTWQKKKGDRVNEGDIIFSYETDKSAFDEPAQFSGVILHTFAEEGDVVDCLAPVCIIGEEGEDISSLLGQAAPAEEKKEETKAEEAAPAEKAEQAAAPEATKVEGDRLRISPR
ncbi:MAG: lipoyl domain-containing protein, partial [Clostridia bacterium]|nr:lipoyl domain-containing protein [Clostridia bacterium]